MSKSVEDAVVLFRQQGGTLRTAEALRLGIHPRTLYAMRDSGVLEQLSRGLYRLADLPPLSNPDLVTVALRVPQAVICLISALAFHELTTQIPHAVDVALSNGSTRPSLDYPPLRVFWFSGAAWSEGVETHQVDEVPVRIYNPEKSIADSFKYRRKLGLDIALEALRLYHRGGSVDVGKLLHYARICRVERVMRPYLEALVPGPVPVRLSTILDLPPPELQGYSRESTVAEKFQAMVYLGEINSRMKDFYDVWFLATHFAFDGPMLARAIRETFQRRETTLSTSPAAFSQAFAKDGEKQAQWMAFIRRHQLEHAPVTLEEAVQGIAAFLQPVTLALTEGQSLNQRWSPGGPWSSGE